MKLKKPKITNLSSRGFKIICGKKKYYIDFKHFPCLTGITILQLFNCWFNQYGILWPSYGVDLSFEGLACPKKEMLICNTPPSPYDL
jgi:hypothetical protein